MIRRALASAAIGTLSLLWSCASSERFPSGWGEVTVAPGDTGTCLSSPCRVYFQMPPGTGSYPVTVRHLAAGAFPAGQKVNLGHFVETSAIRVEGTDAPPAYVYVPESGASDQSD